MSAALSTRSPSNLIGSLVLGVAALAGASVGLIALSYWFDSDAAVAPLSPPRPAPPRAPDAATPEPAAAAAPVRKARRASRPLTPREPAQERAPLPVLTSTHEWPPEPEAPARVDEARFVEAFVLLCGPHADPAVRAWYGPWLVRAAREQRADPFLLGALTFHMSGCSEHGGRHGLGLAGLDPSLYERDVRGGYYVYPAFEGGTWLERKVKIDRFPFREGFLRSPESGLYFAAAFLRSWREQAAGLRAAFVQPSEYRHYVSHYVWGDRVQSHREEDAILVERRRLLEYYGALKPRPPVRWRGFELGCPLDGCPRVLTSTLGDARDHGARLHAGNDFESTRGEPVRAAADGVVVFAGVDLPGRGAASRIPIWAQRNVDPESMGAGGLYVCVDHGESPQHEQLLTCYMHLETATVVQGRLLKRGDQVGIVGTSGIRESRPHLHFELHSTRGVHRASELLKGLALGHPAAHPAQAGARPSYEFAQ